MLYKELNNKLNEQKTSYLLDSMTQGWGNVYFIDWLPVN